MVSARNQVQPSAKVEQGIPLSNPAPTCGIDANLELIPQLESTPWNWFQVSKFFKNSPSAQVAASFKGWTFFLENKGKQRTETEILLLNSVWQNAVHTQREMPIIVNAKHFKANMQKCRIFTMPKTIKCWIPIWWPLWASAVYRGWVLTCVHLELSFVTSSFLKYICPFSDWDVLSCVFLICTYLEHIIFLLEMSSIVVLLP